MIPLQLEIKLKNYCDIPSTANLQKLLQKLSTISLSTLNDCCLENKTIREILSFTDFQPFWQEKMARIIVSNLPNFRFQETKSLNAFELTLGYYNYLQALKNPKQQNKYIPQALSFHSFQALNYYAEDFIRQFQENKESLKLTVEAIPLFEKEAIYHGTPGFLLVALLYYRLALSYKSSSQNKARNAFQLVIKNLELAILAEKESTIELYNAYFGQNLSQTNPFKQPSLKAIQNACILQAGTCLNKADIDFAKKAASLGFPSCQTRQSIQAKPNLSKIELAILADSPEAIALASKNNFEEKNNWKESPLVFAVRHKKINSVRYLLAQGNRFKDPAALQYALALEDVGLRRLLGHNFAASDKENSAFCQAILNSNTAFITSLLKDGASPDQIIPNGKTAFEQLFIMNNHDCISLFLRYGASLTTKNRQGETLLFCLLETKNTFEENKGYFRRFLTLGADLNAQNNQGETMLCKAVKRSDLNAVIFLLAQPGIDLELTDKKGRSAFYYAERGQNQWLSSLLRDHSQASAKREIHLANRFFAPDFAAPKPFNCILGTKGSIGFNFTR